MYCRKNCKMSLSCIVLILGGKTVMQCFGLGLVFFFEVGVGFLHGGSYFVFYINCTPRGEGMCVHAVCLYMCV